MGLVLIAELALVVDGEPSVTTDLQADATGLEGAGGAVVTRNRSAADVGDVGFRHTPLNGRGGSPIPGRGPSVPGRRARAEPVRGISGLSPRAARPRSRRPARRGGSRQGADGSGHAAPWSTPRRGSGTARALLQ